MYIQLQIRFKVIYLLARGFDSSTAGSTYMLADEGTDKIS